MTIPRLTLSKTGHLRYRQADSKIHIESAWVAQLVEHQSFNLSAQGSSPCPGAKRKKNNKIYIDK